MNDCQFPHQQRLTKPGEYSAVFNQGKRSGIRQFNILCRPNTLPYARLGLVVARKYLRRAVDRNRIKRLIRESFRTNKQFLCGIDVVVMLRADIRNLSNPILRSQLAQGWEQVTKLCVNS